MSPNGTSSLSHSRSSLVLPFSRLAAGNLTRISLFRSLGSIDSIRDFPAIAKEAGAGLVAPEKALVTPARVRTAHDAGLQVVAWTANTPEEWDRLAAAGVDAIITDDPAALLDFLRKRGLR